LTHRWALLVVVAVTCAACEKESQNAGGNDVFARTQYTIVWSDPAGLDLMSAEGTYLRASIESLDASAVNGNADTAAPGFWNTLTEPAKAEVERFFRMGPAQPEFGIKRYEVLRKVDDHQSTTVTVCSYNQQIAHQGTDKATYEFGGTGPFGSVVTFEKEGRTSPPADQSGPEMFARTPVFGSWQTTGWEVGFFPDGDPCAGRSLPGVTRNAWPQTRGSGPYVSDQVPRQRTSPGWPRVADTV